MVLSCDDTACAITLKAERCEAPAAPLVRAGPSVRGDQDAVERDLCVFTSRPEGQKETCKDVFGEVLENPVPLLFITNSVSGPNTREGDNVQQRAGGDGSAIKFEKQSEEYQSEDVYSAGFRTVLVQAAEELM